MRNKILFLGLIFSFIYCQNFEEEVILEEQIKENPYLGIWHSVERVIPFGAYLKIDSNYNFTYSGGACVARFFSKGSWTITDDTLFLNSFEPEECYYLSEFGINCRSFDDDYQPTTSIKGCKPSDIKEYVIFNQEKFIIKDSILTHIQKPNNLCPEIKDNFNKESDIRKYLKHIKSIIGEEDKSY